MKTKYKFFITPEAEKDVLDAKEWYKNTKVKGLAKRFTEDIKRAIRRASQNPYAFAIRYDNIRLALPDVFPYPIHFYVDEPNGSIIIVGIVFEGRDRNAITQRTST